MTDGDTIRVDGITVGLRLSTCKKRVQAGYSKATCFTAELCPIGSTAIVDEDNRQTEGSFGRTLAKVFCSGKMHNEELLNKGHAVIYETFCDESEIGCKD